MKSLTATQALAKSRSREAPLRRAEFRKSVLAIEKDIARASMNANHSVGTWDGDPEVLDHFRARGYWVQKETVSTSECSVGYYYRIGWGPSPFARHRKTTTTADFWDQVLDFLDRTSRRIFG